MTANTLFHKPRFAYALVFCAGLATGGFATAYLAIYAVPYGVLASAIRAGTIILPTDAELVERIRLRQVK